MLKRLGSAPLGEYFKSTKEHQIPKPLSHTILCLFSFADSFLLTRAGAHQYVPLENECCRRADSLTKGRKKENITHRSIGSGTWGQRVVYLGPAQQDWPSGPAGVPDCPPRPPTWEPSCSCASCSETNVLRGLRGRLST